MASELYNIIEGVSREKGIDPQIVVTAVEDAIVVATRKYYKTQENLRAQLDKDTGKIRAFVTDEEGEEALRAQLMRIAEGTTPRYKPGMTLHEVGMVYSHGDPNWSKNVAALLDVPETIKVVDLMKGKRASLLDKKARTKQYGTPTPLNPILPAPSPEQEEIDEEDQSAQRQQQQPVTAAEKPSAQPGNAPGNPAANGPQVDTRTPVGGKRIIPPQGRAPGTVPKAFGVNQGPVTEASTKSPTPPLARSPYTNPNTERFERTVLPPPPPPSEQSPYTYDPEMELEPIAQPSTREQGAKRIGSKTAFKTLQPDVQDALRAMADCKFCQTCLDHATHTRLLPHLQQKHGVSVAVANTAAHEAFKRMEAFKRQRYKLVPTTARAKLLNKKMRVAADSPITAGRMVKFLSRFDDDMPIHTISAAPTYPQIELPIYEFWNAGGKPTISFDTDQFMAHIDKINKEEAARWNKNPTTASKKAAETQTPYRWEIRLPGAAPTASLRRRPDYGERKIAVGITPGAPGPDYKAVTKDKSIYNDAPPAGFESPEGTMPDAAAAGTRRDESRNRRKANTELAGVSRRYHSSMPIQVIKDILTRYGFNGDAMDGIYTGEEGKMHEQCGPNTWIAMTWHKLPRTGLWEIVVYLS